MASLLNRFLLFPWLLPCVLIVLSSFAIGQNTTVSLKNGMKFGPGLYSEIGNVDPNPKKGGSSGSKMVVRLDDGLRYIYFNRRQLVGPPTQFQTPVRISLPNEDRTVFRDALNVQGVRQPINVTPFDQFGRRVYSLRLANGRADVVQGITSVSSKVVRVEGLKTDNSYVWDMRLSLSAIPRETLLTILKQNAQTPGEWLEIQNLFSEADRFGDAKQILTEAIQRFPELESLRPEITVLDQLLFEQMLDEVRTRQDSGQYGLASSMLESYPLDQLSIESRLKIQDQMTKLEDEAAQRSKVLNELERLIAKLDDPQLQSDLAPVVAEIKSALNPATYNRLISLARLSGDESMSVEQRVALGIGGWLLGSGSNESNLPTVRAAIQGRELVTQYLNSTQVAERQSILEELRKSEAGRPEVIAKIVSQIRPPLAFDQPSIAPGRYQVTVPTNAALDGMMTTYTVQLPPEYDPNRRYPCILALHGQYGGVDPTLDWWCGTYNERFDRCIGEASRHGYIVVVPDWSTGANGVRYRFTEDEQSGILACLRDAKRRTAIDTDRVFIAGHYLGATAAWDIAMSHPDLWAGLVSIGGEKGEFGNQYRANAEYVASYFVTGEFDGAPSPMARNGDIFDDYLSRSAVDFTLVEFIGRGNDHFQEDLPNIIDWMNQTSHIRRSNPEELELRAVRTGDRSFWWLEVQEYRENKGNNPLLPFDVKRVIDIEAKRTQSNSFQIRSLPAETFTVWLSPDIVDFSQRISVNAGRSDVRETIEPSIEILLEDARQRAERQHPYWAKIDVQ